MMPARFEANAMVDAVSVRRSWPHEALQKAPRAALETLLKELPVEKLMAERSPWHGDIPPDAVHFRFIAEPYWYDRDTGGETP